MGRPSADTRVRTAELTHEECRLARAMCQGLRGTRLLGSPRWADDHFMPEAWGAERSDDLPTLAHRGVRGFDFWPERGWVRTSWEPPAPCSPWNWGSGLPPAHCGVSRTFLLQPVSGWRRNRPSSPAWPPEGRAGILSGLEAPSWPGGESHTAQHALAASGHLAGPGAGEPRRGGQSEERVAAAAAGVASCLAGRGLLLPDAQTWLGLSCC